MCKCGSDKASNGGTSPKQQQLLSEPWPVCTAIKPSGSSSAKHDMTVVVDQQRSDDMQISLCAASCPMSLFWPRLGLQGFFLPYLTVGTGTLSSGCQPPR